MPKGNLVDFDYEIKHNSIKVIGRIILLSFLITGVYFLTESDLVGVLLIIYWATIIYLTIFNKKKFIDKTILDWARKFQTCHPTWFSIAFYIQILLFALALTTLLTSKFCFNYLDKNISVLFLSQMTIISIVVAITILTINLSGNYGTRITQELKYFPDIYIILLIFVVSFLFNLFYLGNLGINFTLIFKGTTFWLIFFEISSIFVLFGYSYNILTLNQPLNQVNYYITKILTIKGDEDRLANLVYALFDIAMGSLERGDTYTANDTLEKFSHIVDQSDINLYKNMMTQIIENLDNLEKISTNKYYSSTIRIVIPLRNKIKKIKELKFDC
jgi:hypothetical protein